TDIRKDLHFQEQFKEAFDRILIDAPCSATGVIRRHPEGKWNKTLSLIRHNQKIQRELLRTSLKLLKPGGYLIYSVCSLEREEGEENLEFALSTGFEVWENETAGKLFPERFKGGDLRLFPHRDNTDGFFYATLKKPH
ncbi:MAG: 16S rRNA (cytosine(967)-C(5))-methyltransferase RsmB, partial [Desulfurobacteriaceae bacterium]